MAKQGAKKMKDDNKKRLDLLLRIILISNAIYIVVRMAIMHSSFTWKHWIGLMVTSAAYFLPYKQLASMAKPVYSDNGELLDGGFDLSTGGVCEYLYDVIYITVFVQLMSIISEKIWWTYLVIPAFAGYKIFGLLRGTFFSGGSELLAPIVGAYTSILTSCCKNLQVSSANAVVKGEVEDEKTRKKREKMEKKASRGKMIKTRAR